MKVYYMNVKSINADDEKWFKYLSQKRIEKVNRLKKTNKKSLNKSVIFYNVGALEGTRTHTMLLTKSLV